MRHVQIQRVSASRGLHWVRRALSIFARKPLTWTVLNLVILFIGSALIQIPIAGGLLFALLTPVFAGGLTLGCRDADAGKPFLPGYLFAGFQRNAAALVSIGGVYMVGQILITGLLIGIGGSELQAVIQATISDESNSMPQSVSDRALLAVIVASALFVPLAMAVWFAPVLAVLDNLRAVQAIRLSLQGCVRNLPAMTVYTIAMGALLIGLLFAVRSVLTLLPDKSVLREPLAMLAMTFWVSLTLISAYVGYRDIFAWGEEPPPTS
jgi:hypothetical protein